MVTSTKINVIAPPLGQAIDLMSKSVAFSRLLSALHLPSQGPDLLDCIPRWAWSGGQFWKAKGLENQQHFAEPIYGLWLSGK